MRQAVILAASPDASWSAEPGAIALILVLGYVYVRRWRKVRAHDGARAAPTWRLWMFIGGLVAIAIALLSPVDSLGHQLLLMHMVQHVILLDLVPILLILGLTKALMRPVTKRLQPIEHGPLGHPVVAVFLYVGSMWIWHIPALYDLAARNDAVHVLEHIFFLSAGLLYWWHLIGPLRTRLSTGGLGPVGYMVSTKIAVGILGIVLTFAPDALYAFYIDQPDYWGLSPTDDQAVAGLIMALEQSIVMGIALTWLFVRMINESEREEQRKERYGDPDDRLPAGPSEAALAAQARVRAARAAQTTAPDD
jgi:cytochrome c oxidase assembly factor CtaG